jgi:hypothetical protein
MRRKKKEQYQQEAEKLALLPLEEQKKAVALIRTSISDARRNKGEREEARRHARVLEGHLKLLNRRRGQS